MTNADAPEDTTGRLVCPNKYHLLSDTPAYMDEDPEDDSIVVCPLCKYVFQNLLKYPVMEMVDTATGETHLKNMLTGERTWNGG